MNYYFCKILFLWHQKVGSRVNVTFWFWTTPNGQFCQFATFPIFSHRSGSEWLRMTNFTLFATFPIFSHQSASEWLGMANFTFQSFSTKVAQNDSEWQISPNLQLFQFFLTKVAQNDLEWPISPILQLSESFPTKVAQNDLEWPILLDLQLYQSFPTEVAQNDSEWWILLDSQLFQAIPTKVAQNGQFHPIRNFSNLFPPKCLRMTQNGQLCPICNFSNFFPPKWLRMTRNGQFCMAKIKYTLIQGNFYERLLFYMDSCALSPMAFLFKNHWNLLLNLLEVSSIKVCCIKSYQIGVLIHAKWVCFESLGVQSVMHFNSLQIISEDFLSMRFFFGSVIRFAWNVLKSFHNDILWNIHLSNFPSIEKRILG